MGEINDNNRFRSNDPYVVLGVPRGADSATVRSAYKDLARKYHTDHHPDDPHAKARMQAINWAHDRLNPKSSNHRAAPDIDGPLYKNPFDDIIRAMFQHVQEIMAAHNPMMADHHVLHLKKRLMELEELSGLCVNAASESRHRAETHFQSHYAGLRHIFKKHSSKNDRLAAKITMIHLAQTQHSFEQAAKIRLAQIHESIQHNTDPRSGMLKDLFISLSYNARIQDVATSINVRRQCFDTAAAVLSGQRITLRPLPHLH